MCNYNMQTQYYCYGCFINTTDFPVVKVYVTVFPVVKVYVTDFPVVKVHVDELSSARISHLKLCATLPPSDQSILPYLYY
jgi:hypothetical protein